MIANKLMGLDLFVLDDFTSKFAVFFFSPNQGKEKTALEGCINILGL